MDVMLPMSCVWKVLQVKLGGRRTSGPLIDFTDRVGGRFDVMD